MKEINKEYINVLCEFIYRPRVVTIGVWIRGKCWSGRKRIHSQALTDACGGKIVEQTKCFAQLQIFSVAVSSPPPRLKIFKVTLNPLESLFFNFAESFTLAC